MSLPPILQQLHGRIDREQVVDYHRRKGMDLRTVERWLAPYLDYEPEAPRPEGGVAASEPSAGPEARSVLTTS